ncbi:uncharacterized protein [Nicotiana sylvestris]|uniref:uncharacterized protein n=1 Tax=Nicotiana sylvestris TaxID=4096 RepID=UPI00388CB6A5
MTPLTFTDLCEMLVREGDLRPAFQTIVEEQVAKTLYLLAHNTTNRELTFIFRRSGESDCIGAIDGTHIRVKVSQCEALRYRGRKDYPTQNVLVACTFDLKFTYVLAGWEGTASDSRIMKEALNRQDLLKLPEGKYYLIDAGLMLRSGLIMPYRGEQYHLKDSTEPSYSVETKKLIIFACCILHNYLRGAYPNDELLAQVDAELVNDNDAHDEPPNPWQIINMPKRSKTSSGDTNLSDNTFVCIWSNAMDNALIDAFYHEHTLGNKVGGTFTAYTIDNIVKEMQSKFSDKVFTKERVHNRMRNIKTKFSECYDTFQNGMSGFAWDSNTNMWNVESEIKPEAAEWRNKLIRNYDKLIELYGRDRATGK